MCSLCSSFFSLRLLRQRRLPRLPRLKLRSVLLLHSGGKEAKGMSRHCCCNDYYYWLLQLSLQMCRKWIRTTSRGNWSVGAAQTAAAIAASVSALVLQTLRGYVAVRQAVLRGSVECVNTMLSFKRCFLFRWWRRLRCLQFRWTRSRWTSWSLWKRRTWMLSHRSTIWLINHCWLRHQKKEIQQEEIGRRSDVERGLRCSKWVRLSRRRWSVWNK